MVGNEINQENKAFYEDYGQSFNFGGNPTIQNTAIQSASTSVLRARTVGFFGNATLSWRDQAYLNVTGREDVVSTMPRGHRAFFYPSVSVAYVLTELEPLQGNPVLTFAKVRGSFAQVGQAGRYYKLLLRHPQLYRRLLEQSAHTLPPQRHYRLCALCRAVRPRPDAPEHQLVRSGIRPAALPQPACRQLHLLAAEHQEPDIPPCRWPVRPAPPNT